MPQANNKAKFLLALQGYQNDSNFSLQLAAKLYKVSYTTIRYWYNGI